MWWQLVAGGSHRDTGPHLLIEFFIGMIDKEVFQSISLSRSFFRRPKAV